MAFKSTFVTLYFLLQIVRFPPFYPKNTWHFSIHMFTFVHGCASTMCLLSIKQIVGQIVIIEGGQCCLGMNMV